MVLSAAVLGLGICCRNHVVFEPQVKYHKHSLLRVSQATASVANQFPATWYSFLCQPARSSWSCFQPGLLTVVFVVDSLSIYAINKQLKPIYNYAASIIEVVCVCAPWRHSCLLLPPWLLTRGRQAGSQWCSSLCLGPLAAVNWSWSWSALSTRISHLRRFTFTFAGTSATIRWSPSVCVSLCACVSVCVCVDTCD